MDQLLEIKNIDDAINLCRKTKLKDWALVEYAQKLVANKMQYSYTNSLDMPRRAFEKGRGYCWQISGALYIILKKLDFNVKKVYSVRNLFPPKTYEGVPIKEYVSGHIWLSVKIGNIEKYVCPGDINNYPGQIHFKPLTRVKSWNIAVALFSYIGSFFVNNKRYKNIIKLKEKYNNMK